MNANDTLTSAKRFALDDVRMLLGDNLADFLLSGLGETSSTHHCTFSAQSIPTHGTEVTYQLVMTNDTKQGYLSAVIPLGWQSYLTCSGSASPYIAPSSLRTHQS